MQLGQAACLQLLSLPRRYRPQRSGDAGNKFNFSALVRILSRAPATPSNMLQAKPAKKHGRGVWVAGAAALAALCLLAVRSKRHESAGFVLEPEDAGWPKRRVSGGFAWPPSATPALQTIQAVLGMGLHEAGTNPLERCTSPGCHPPPLPPAASLPHPPTSPSPPSALGD